MGYRFDNEYIEELLDVCSEALAPIDWKIENNENLTKKERVRCSTLEYLYELLLHTEELDIQQAQKLKINGNPKDKGFIKLMSRIDRRNKIEEDYTRRVVCKKII